MFHIMLFFGQKSTVESLCYVHVLSQVLNKLDEKTLKCIFLGIDNIKNGYRCYDPKNKRFYVFDDVKFDENTRVR